MTAALIAKIAMKDAMTPDEVLTEMLKVLRANLDKSDSETLKMLRDDGFTDDQIFENLSKFVGEPNG